MFDNNLFSKILQKISNTYSSISEFAEKSEVNRTYLSKYINMKLENPPTPKILERIANASHGIIDYQELMQICGYNKFTEISIHSFSDIISLNEWRLLFGKYEKIKLSKSEQIVFYKIYDTIDSSICNEKQKYEITFNSDEYTKYATSDAEKDSILRIYLYLMLIISKKLELSEMQNIVMETIVQLPPFHRNENVYVSEQFYMCPIYNSISAEPPHWKEENIIGYIPLDYTMYNIDNAEDCFYFRMKDNSLNKIVAKDTYILLKKQNTAKTEDIVLVSIDNKEPVIRKCMQLDKDIAIFQSLSKEDSNMDIIMNKQRNYKILGTMIGQMNINN